MCAVTSRSFCTQTHQNQDLFSPSRLAPPSIGMRIGESFPTANKNFIDRMAMPPSVQRKERVAVGGAQHDVRVCLFCAARRQKVILLLNAFGGPGLVQGMTHCKATSEAKKSLMQDPGPGRPTGFLFTLFMSLSLPLSAFLLFDFRPTGP